MASTNKTTNLELSQYVSSDKPTYLVDYNSDMAKIDTGVHTAQVAADTASTAATNAQTTAEGAQTTANTAITNAATADGKASQAQTDIGTLANLETTVKNNVVSATNEVNSKVGNLNNLPTTAKTDLVSSITEVYNDFEGTVLFSGNTDTGTSNLTLSQAIENFNRFEVEYYDENNNSYDVSEFIVETGVRYNLFTVCVVDSNVSLFSRAFTVSGTSFTNIYSRKAWVYDATIVQDETSIKIKKIIGYK